MNQTETLKRLNEEKEYEDRLAEHLSDFFIASLPEIDELSDEEMDEIRKGLVTIATESQIHSHMFNELIQMVVDNGEDNY